MEYEDNMGSFSLWMSDLRWSLGFRIKTFVIASGRFVVSYGENDGNDCRWSPPRGCRGNANLIEDLMSAE